MAEDADNEMTVYVSVPMTTEMCESIDEIARTTHRSRAGMIRAIIADALSQTASRNTPFTDALRDVLSSRYPSHKEDE